MSLSLKKLSERGDTIVEVLVAIGVLSLILAAAFVLTNRSLQGTRSAQERLNATKLVETQLEQIKHLAATDSDAIFGTGVPVTPPSFCIGSDGTVKVSSTSACQVGPDGGTPTSQPVYNLSVTRSGNTFTVRNVWLSVSGRNNEAVEMSYRVYE